MGTYRTGNRTKQTTMDDWGNRYIIKQNGGPNASTDAELRKELIEELADVLMYYNDVLLCYGITADDLKKIYTAKFEKNMKRW